MLNEWVYCPHLAFLEWVHREWAETADKAAGRRAHAATEKGRAPALPAPEAIDDEARLKTRPLLSDSERLGLTAKLDVLHVEDGRIVPLDVKMDKHPHVAEGAYLPERVQVCAQGLILRDGDYHSDEGALWFADSRERVRVPFTDELVSETLQAISEMRLPVPARRSPPPLDHSPKCVRCSLLPVCLPDEVAWFRSGVIPRTPPPAASPALPLYVQTPGARITKSGQCLVVRGWTNPTARCRSTRCRS